MANPRTRFPADHPIYRRPPTVGPVTQANILTSPLDPRHAELTVSSARRAIPQQNPLTTNPLPFRSVQRPTVSKSAPINATGRYVPKKDAVAGKRKMFSLRKVAREIVEPPKCYAVSARRSHSADDSSARQRPIFQLGTLHEQHRDHIWRDNRESSSSESENSSDDSHNIPDIHRRRLRRSSANTTKEPPPELIRAAERLALTITRLQYSPRGLPFLRRNIHRSLKFHGIKFAPDTQLQSRGVRVTYVLDGQDDDVQWDGHMLGYKCPLCKVFGEFGDRRSLQRHMGDWHEGVELRWSVGSRGERVTVIIPDVPLSESEMGCGEEEESDELSSTSSSTSESIPSLPIRRRPFSLSFRYATKTATNTLPSARKVVKVAPVSNASVPSHSGASVNAQFRSPTPTLPPRRSNAVAVLSSIQVHDTPTHPPSLTPEPDSSVATKTSSQRSRLGSNTSNIHRGTIRHGEPSGVSPRSWPIPDASTSATAKTKPATMRAGRGVWEGSMTPSVVGEGSSSGPFRSEATEYTPTPAPGSVLTPSLTPTPVSSSIPIIIPYSARLTGPKPYDILSTRPLASAYGLLAWLVLDREEELFECDDVRDEDKVVLACWGRWISTEGNRFRFLCNYYEGVKEFVREWWEIIDQGADFAALRVFLLTLGSYNFLTGEQLCKVLRLYSRLTGMDSSELGHD